MKNISFFMSWFLSSNDRRCLLFWVATGLMLILSIFYGPGEPLLTRTVNQQVSELAKIDYREANNFWWDADKSLAKTSPTPTKIASEKSWWPWVTTGILFVISLIYTPISKREEAIAAGKEAWDFITAKTETEDVKMKPEEPGKEAKRQASIVEKISRQVGWKRLLSFEMLSEFVGNFVQRWLFKKR